MSVGAGDLVGAWRLESWSIISPDGEPPIHPLGPDAAGLIMYTADGHVSATLMRSGRPREAPTTDTAKAAAYADSFAYAGRYEVSDGAVRHHIGVSTNPALVGTTSLRHITLEADRLTLEGPDFQPGSRRSQRIVWRRAAAAPGG